VNSQFNLITKERSLAEVSKNLDTDLKTISLDYQNN